MEMTKEVRDNISQCLFDPICSRLTFSEVEGKEIIC